MPLQKKAIHEPFDEFPREEILYFINYLVGFLTGFFQNNNTKYNIKIIDWNL